MYAPPARVGQPLQLQRLVEGMCSHGGVDAALLRHRLQHAQVEAQAAGLGTQAINDGLWRVLQVPDTSHRRGAVRHGSNRGVQRRLVGVAGAAPVCRAARRPPQQPRLPAGMRAGCELHSTQ